MLEPLLSDGTPQLQLELRSEGESVRVVVTGELDLATAPWLQARLDQVWARRLPVLLDVSGLAFVDLDGLRLLLAACRVAMSDGRSVLLTRGSEAVERLIDLTGVRSRLSFVQGGSSLAREQAATP